MIDITQKCNETDVALDCSIGLLLIDDDEEDRAIVKHALRHVHCQASISEAASKNEACAVLGLRNIDCILIDYRMGECNGLDLWTEIRHMLPPFCPAILITGVGAEDVAASALRHGFSDYISKGNMDGDRLAQSIRRAISHARIEQRLNELAFHDALTGLASRALFCDRLQQAIDNMARNSVQQALAFFDLDKFKMINDRFGHQAGDAVLIEIARRLRSELRPSDTAARFGGDEFAIILSDIQSGAICHQILSRILKKLCQPIAIDSELCPSISVTASVGVVIIENQDMSAEIVLRHADHVMYEVKRAGGTGIRFFDATVDATVQLAQKEKDSFIRGMDNGEFTLYYQPKMNMVTHELIGCEALLRWAHPTLGILTPDRFWNALQDGKINRRVGEWVACSALEQLTKWQVQGLQTQVSINLAVQHFMDHAFIAMLSELLRAFPLLPPQALEIELLETEGIQDIAKATCIMNRCKEMGVTFAIDDFGAGHSSLTYLRHLPMDVLKIDRSFVCNMLGNSNDQAIVRGITSMGQAFARRVIAEGVESASHADKLIEFGCIYGQGFGIAYPMPASDLHSWWVNYRKNHGNMEHMHRKPAMTCEDSA